MQKILFNGFFFKALCKRHQKTIPQVGAGAGVNPQTIRRYIKGDTSPDLTPIYKLACYFNVDMNCFLSTAEHPQQLLPAEQYALDNSFVAIRSDENTVKYIEKCLQEYSHKLHDVEQAKSILQGQLRDAKIEYVRLCQLKKALQLDREAWFHLKENHYETWKKLFYCVKHEGKDPYPLEPLPDPADDEETIE